MSLPSFPPIRYSCLIPSTLAAFTSGRIAIPVCSAQQGVVTTLPVPARDFYSFTPDEALGFLQGLNRQVQGDQGTLLGQEDARVKTGYVELGGQGLIFADAPDDASFLPDNSTWVLEKNNGDPEAGSSTVVLHNFDNGQFIRSEVDVEKGVGLLTVRDGDLSLSVFATPYEVAQVGLAFYASVQSLGRFLGLSHRELRATHKPVAEWIQRALGKIHAETFAASMQEQATDGDVLPVDWSQGGRQDYLGRHQVFDEGQPSAKRVEVPAQNLQRVLVEILRPVGPGFPVNLQLSGDVQKWVESIWRGE